MDGKRATPGGAGEGEPLAPESSAPQADSERYGPLELARLRKEDGRSLIVFSRAEGPP